MTDTPDLSDAAIDAMIAELKYRTTDAHTACDAIQSSLIADALMRAAAMIAAMREKMLPDLPPPYRITALDWLKDHSEWPWMVIIFNDDADEIFSPFYGASPRDAVLAALKTIEEKNAPTDSELAANR